MLHKTVVRVLFVAVMAAASMLAGRLQAQVVLPNLPPGSEYQLAFVTADYIVGSYGYEYYYNDFAQTEAAPLNAMLPAGTTWSAITSTYSDGISASTNAPTYAGVPIYDTRGDIIVPSTGSLWSGTLQNPIYYDQAGRADMYSYVWTGTNPDGSPAEYTLGGPSGWSEFGHPAISEYEWVACGQNLQTYTYSVYALSSVITVPVPEPSALAMLASGLLGVAGVSGVAYVRRWRRAKA